MALQGRTGTYLGFKEVLGTSDALQGDVYLGELGQRQQPTVLLQLPCRGLVENEQELQEGESRRRCLLYPSASLKRPARIPLAPAKAILAKYWKRVFMLCVMDYFVPYQIAKSKKHGAGGEAHG